MKFFIDSADVTIIRDLASGGLIDGVTTNPSLIAKSGANFLSVIAEICEAIPEQPVSAEVVAPDFTTMLAEGHKLAAIAKNVVVKLPLTTAGLKTCKVLSDKGIKTNVTLCFSAVQALLAAKAGATYISPFVGRLDDIAIDGMELISDIKQIYSNYSAITTQILVASVRHPRHVVDAARIGADVVTIPPSIMFALIKHPLTDIGVEGFIRDWQKTGQSIL